MCPSSTQIRWPAGGGHRVGRPPPPLTSPHASLTAASSGRSADGVISNAQHGEQHGDHCRASVAPNRRATVGCQQGRRHEVLMGGRISWAPKPNYPQNLDFSSDFVHFILKMLENTNKNITFQEKDTKISKFFGGRPPAVFKSARS